jgi:hypothetical protein
MIKENLFILVKMVSNSNAISEEYRDPDTCVAMFT